MWRKKGGEVERRISRGEGEKSDLIESLPRIIWSRKLKPTTQISCEPKLDRPQARLSPGNQLWGRTIRYEIFVVNIIIGQKIFCESPITS